MSMSLLVRMYRRNLKVVRVGQETRVLMTHYCNNCVGVSSMSKCSAKEIKFDKAHVQVVRATTHLIQYTVRC